MLRSVRSIAIFLGALGLTAGAFAADTYNIDPVHSTVIFRIKHLDVSYLYGRFNAPTGAISVDVQDPTKDTFSASIDANNVDTNQPKRDAHLKSPDFFNAKEFPNITFKSTGVKKGSRDNTLEVSGDLTLHGVTKPVTITMEQIGAAKTPMGDRIGFEGTVEIKKSDFGIKGVPGVGDDVRLILDIEAVKAA